MNQTFYGCASITGAERTKFENKENIPGPGTYDPSLKDTEQIPKWTLKPKVEFTGCFHNSKSFIPAPGVYNIPSAFKEQKKEGNKIPKISKDKEKNYSNKSSPRIALQIPSFVDKKGGHSFGYRSEVNIHETSPGPVYYIGEKDDENRAKKNLHYLTGFGSSLKSGQKKSENELPGPGSYSFQPAKTASAGGWSFSRSPKKDKKETSNPTGPGEYNIYLKYDATSPKFKGKYPPPKEVTYNASPGSYDIPDTINKRGAIFKANSSNKENRENINDSPSPFSYDRNTSTLKKGGFSLGKKTQFIDQSGESPGPGSYEIRENLEDKVGGYMSRKIEEKKKASDSQDNFYKYSPKGDLVSYRSPQYSFGSEQATAPNGNLTLGPGSYYIEKKYQGESYTIAKNQRFKSLVKEKLFGDAIMKKDYYSTFGYLPEYLKPKNKLNVTSKTVRIVRDDEISN